MKVRTYCDPPDLGFSLVYEKRDETDDPVFQRSDPSWLVAKIHLYRADP